MKEQAAARRTELKTIGAEGSTLVALGNAVYGLLLAHFKDYKIIKITHYSAPINAEKYSAEVVKALEAEVD